MPRLSAFALLILLSGCAGVRPTAIILPQPRLAPVAMAMDVSLNQRLRFTRSDDTRETMVIDAQLDVDGNVLRLAGFALGRRVLMLVWDGAHLDEQRDRQWPEQVAATQILRDIQYVYAPHEALQSALPEDWRVDERGARRLLRFRDTTAIVIDYATMPRWHGAVRIDNRFEGYRLDIESTTADLDSE